MNETIILKGQEEILLRLKELKDLILQQQAAAASHDTPLNIREAAGFTGLKPSTLYKMVHYKKISALQRKKRGRLLFTKSSLINFINSKNL